MAVEHFAASSSPAPATAATPRVLIVDDDEMMCALLERWLGLAGAKTITAKDGSKALATLSAEPIDVVCLDLGLPDMDGMLVLQRVRKLYAELPVIILTADSAVDSAVRAMQDGAYDYLQKPVDRNKLATTVRNAFERWQMSRKLAALERDDDEPVFHGIVGSAPSMRHLFRQIDRVAQSDVTVAIRGESGAGKELVAHAVHAASPRRDGPFVALNCAAIPDSLQESELFGHEKGAFTGAQQRRVGRFEEAHGGTLFLDEVAELSLAAQAKLLRVLQERKFVRVGGTREVASDFRLVTATHKDLAAEVEAGRFREDLFFRIAVFDLNLPPLRERAEDIPLLSLRFLSRFHDDKGATKRLAPETLDVFLQHRWPGNVRELQNAIQHAAVVCQGDLVKPEDLPPRLLAASGTESSPDSLSLPPTPVTTSAATVRETDAEPPATAGGDGQLPPVTLQELERMAIEQSLERNRHNVSAAIRELGIGRTTMYRKLKEYGLKL